MYIYARINKDTLRFIREKKAISFDYDKLQIGTLQIQGFPALTKSEKQKMSYHITPKAVCGYPASGFFAWIA